MTVLYINGEHCTSLEQLRSYFSMNLTPESDIYGDLLDYGRHGDIVNWLRDMDENDIADKLDAINIGLTDSQYFSEMVSIISKDADFEPGLKKPHFSKVFTTEKVNKKFSENDAKVQILIRILHSVNEEYVIKVQTDWGTRAVVFNPYDIADGKSITQEFEFKKQSEKEFSETKIYIDDEIVQTSLDIGYKGIVLGQTTINELSRDMDWEIQPSENWVRGELLKEASFDIASSVQRNTVYGLSLGGFVSNLSDDFFVNKSKVVQELTFYSFHLLPDIYVPIDCSDEELIKIIERHNYMRIETKEKDGLMFVRRERDSKGNYVFLRILLRCYCSYGCERVAIYNTNLLTRWKSYNTGENYSFSPVGIL